MPLLDLLNNAQDEMSLPRSTSFVASSEATARQLLAFANREGRELASQFDWPILEREYTWTLVAGQANYALPSDIERHIPDTHWDRNFRWQLLGPLTPQYWQTLKSGVIASGPRRRYRIKGRENNEIYIDPTPSTGDTGQILVLEYISSSWVSPRTWTTGTVFAAGSYCSYNGNYYKTTSGGTSGATAPTWTTGSSSDGAVTWTFWSTAYNQFLADTDFSLLNERTLGLGVQWRFLRSHGFQSWMEVKDEYDRVVAMEAQKLRSATTLSQVGYSGYKFITTANVPDTGFGS